MLKALELAGFKSFADKTRFEFPAGITVIVGPNGSGKSNVVDAIKWVLGEQSVKSLRGKEMADVIFKGSPAGGRKAMNYAEATIVFDNADGRLPVESPEVRVTRRVYRSGEGEYLINNQACRLKDIKDLFRGTGVGTDAYSLIEQGKVDRMLQASPKERRAMFEEAAGISRFKAKKIETQRRLERVAQNLVRLSDIVEEVESRLRTVRAQAGKARQYREWQERLLQLRTQVGLCDWYRFTREWEAASARREALEEQVSQSQSEIRSREEEQASVEVAIGQWDERVSASEQEAARYRESIAVCRAAGDQLQRQLADLGQQRRQLSHRQVMLRDRAGDIDQKLARLTEEMDGELAKLERQREAAVELARSARHWQQRVSRERESAERWQREIAERTRLVSHWEQQAARAAADHAATVDRRKTLAGQLRELDSREEEARTQRREVAHRIDGLREWQQATKARLAELRQDQEEEERLWKRRQDELTALQSRLSGLRERADLLAQLERRREGVGAGPREVLHRAASASAGPFAEVIGLLGDALDVPLNIAPLIDNVLGHRTTAVLLRRGASLEAWCRIRNALPGRVQLLPLDQIGSTTHDFPPSFADRRDQATCLADLVEVAPELEELKNALLGTIYLVRDLPQALQWHRDGFPYPLITRGGEQVNPDGSVSLGPGSTSANIVSRRSELRVLQRGIRTVENQIRMAREEIERMGHRVTDREERIASTERDLLRLNEELADQRVSLLTIEDRLQRLASERSERLRQWIGEERLLRKWSGAMHSAHRLAANARRQLAWTTAAAAAARRQWAAAERSLESAQQALRDAEIALARRDEFVTALRQQLERFEQDRRERTEAVRDTARQLQETSDRCQQVQRQWLDQLARLSLAHWNLEQLEHRLAEYVDHRQQAVESRRQIEKQLEKARRGVRRLEQQLQQQTMDAERWEREREQLEQRYREDFQIELAELVAGGAEQEETERESMDAEIADLRQRIATMGAVNMEALEELEGLEERFALLSGQYNDMVQAKAALERIIQKINADSRRLFAETLETIRRNFQALYRKSFGGGHADLVLEEGVDILEAGIDIVATPPGKPSFNNSLLSGGERALTAVSLLLAIFQYRPSPFCVLDEVDAPFDEANIGRFIDVLKDFLGWTRFVIVTHSKKTMTAADTLYGITMQESGVSKQVSVRFEDVNERGEIRESEDDEAAA